MLTLSVATFAKLQQDPFTDRARGKFATYAHRLFEVLNILHNPAFDAAPSHVCPIQALHDPEFGLKPSCAMAFVFLFVGGIHHKGVSF